MEAHSADRENSNSDAITVVFSAETEIEVPKKEEQKRKDIFGGKIPDYSTKADQKEYIAVDSNEMRRQLNPLFSSIEENELTNQQLLNYIDVWLKANPEDNFKDITPQPADPNLEMFRKQYETILLEQYEAEGVSQEDRQSRLEKDMNRLTPIQDGHPAFTGKSGQYVVLDKDGRAEMPMMGDNYVASNIEAQMRYNLEAIKGEIEKRRLEDPSFMEKKADIRAEVVESRKEKREFDQRFDDVVKKPSFKESIWNTAKNVWQGIGVLTDAGTWEQIHKNNKDLGDRNHKPLIVEKRIDGSEPLARLDSLSIQSSAPPQADIVVPGLGKLGNKTPESDSRRSREADSYNDRRSSDASDDSPIHNGDMKADLGDYRSNIENNRKVIDEGNSYAESLNMRDASGKTKHDNLAVENNSLQSKKKDQKDRLDAAGADVDRLQQGLREQKQKLVQAPGNEAVEKANKAFWNASGLVDSFVVQQGAAQNAVDEATKKTDEARIALEQAKTADGEAVDAAERAQQDNDDLARALTDHEKLMNEFESARTDLSNAGTRYREAQTSVDAVERQIELAEGGTGHAPLPEEMNEAQAQLQAAESTYLETQHRFTETQSALTKSQSDLDQLNRAAEESAKLAKEKVGVAREKSMQATELQYVASAAQKRADDELAKSEDAANKANESLGMAESLQESVDRPEKNEPKVPDVDREGEDEPVATQAGRGTHASYRGDVETSDGEKMAHQASYEVKTSASVQTSTGQAHGTFEASAHGKTGLGQSPTAGHGARAQVSYASSSEAASQTSVTHKNVSEDVSLVSKDALAASISQRKQEIYMAEVNDQNTRSQNIGRGQQKIQRT